MVFFEQLRANLSPVDFARMQEWMMSQDPAEQAAMMEFILARETKAPAVGDAAPDFELPRLGGGAPVRLSQFRTVQPVALIFGSFT
jgi:hypothetical protein